MDGGGWCQDNLQHATRTTPFSDPGVAVAAVVVAAACVGYQIYKVCAIHGVFFTAQQTAEAVKKHFIPRYYYDLCSLLFFSLYHSIDMVCKTHE